MSRRLLASTRPPPRTFPPPASTLRHLSASRPSHSDSTPSTSSPTPSTSSEPPAADPDALDPPDEPESPPPTPKAGNGYRAWLAGDGHRFRHGLKGRTNWIGDTPFPMNPSFSPLPPLPDSTKTRIFNAYVHNVAQPGASDALVVRAIALKFGVAMDRVRAIIRLKELEREWVKEGTPLQTELLKGMEDHLGVRQPGENWKGVELPERDEPTRPSSKVVYEMVHTEAGDTPVFLPLLSRAASRPSTSSSKPPSSRRPKEVVVPASRPGRAATVFRDVSQTPLGAKLAATRTPQTKRGNRRGTPPPSEVETE